MKKYIKSKSGTLVYEIERQSFTEKFRTPEDYFTHATRNVWYSTTGFNMFVQYKGAFYMIDRTEAHGYITSLEFSPVTAEEAAAAKMERAAQAMSEAQEHEAKTAAAALDYDTETAEAEAREARFSADYAAILAKDAAELAAEAGTSNAASIADTTAEYAERARRYATSAEETAEQNAEEAAAAAAETIHDAEPAKHHDGMTEIERTASDAVSQLLEEYAATIGTASHEIEGDIWQAAYRTAAVEIIPEADRPAAYATATDDDRATVSAMVEAIAVATREANPENLEEPAHIYQRYELLAYLGEPDDYDVDAIEAEATRFTADGARVWAAFDEDLAAIAERHQLVTYYAI